jgi:hypothetical protein
VSRKRKVFLAAALVAPAIAAWIWVFVWAARSDTNDDALASVRFTALGAATALLALVVATAAAVFTYPAFREWRREQLIRPELQLGVQVAWRDYKPPLDVLPESTVDVPQKLQLVVVVRNTSEISARDVVINVVVQYWVEMTAIDPEPPELRVRSTLASVPSLTSEGSVDVVAAAKSQERTIHPDLTYLYVLRLEALASVRYAVRVTATGLRTRSKPVRIWLNPVLPKPEPEPEHPGFTLEEIIATVRTAVEPERSDSAAAVLDVGHDGQRASEHA